MTVFKKHKIHRLLGFGITIILFCFVIGGVIWVNIRFPKAEVETFTTDNSMNMNELEITPIQCKVYTPDEFFQVYTDNDHFNYLKDRDGYQNKNWMIVYTVEISNHSDEDKSFQVQLLGAEATNSKWHNGVTRIDNNYNSIYGAQTKESIELVALIKDTQIQYKYIDQVQSDDYYLTASYYPIRRILAFN